MSTSASLVQDASVDRAQFNRDWEAWHVEHEKRRTDGHGFLAVTSLNFLSEEPQAIEGIPGTWSLEDGQAIVDLADGETLEADGLLLQGPRLHRFPCIAERDGVNARAGKVLIEIAKRGGFTIVRPRDPDYDYLASYSGTPTYRTCAGARRAPSRRSMSRATSRSAPPSRASSTSTPLLAR